MRSAATPALRITSSRVTLLGREEMNPDKLFDYLEGRLSPKERAALEEQLMSDKQLQREFAVARQIHAGMRGESREVVLPAPADLPEQGRKMAIRIGVAFMVLMFVNVGMGLYFIFRHESNNPNRPLLQAQMREQITKSLERAELGGSATKGVPDAGRLSILVDLPGNREQEFRTAIASIRDRTPKSAAFAEHTVSTSTPMATEPGSTPPATAEKKSFVVQIVEKPMSQ